MEPMNDLEEIGGWVFEAEAQHARGQDEPEPVREPDPEYVRAVQRRKNFELALGPKPELVSDKERARLWQEADSDTATRSEVVSGTDWYRAARQRRAQTFTR